MFHRVRNSATGTACLVLGLSGHKLTRARRLINKFNCSVVSNSFATLWTIDHQVPLSVGFPRQEYWSGLPFPSSGDLPNPRIKSVSPALAGGFFTTEPPEKPPIHLVAQSVKNLPTVQEIQVPSLSWEDPLEKEMANHSSILAWRISWTEEAGRLQSMGLQKS